MKAAVAVAVASSAGGTGTEGEILIRGPMLLRGYRDGDDGRVLGPRRDAGLVRHRRCRSARRRWEARRLRPHGGRHHHRSGEGLARCGRTHPDGPSRRRRGRGLEAAGPRMGRAGRGLGRGRPRAAPRSTSSVRWSRTGSPPGRPPRSWSWSTTSPAPLRARSGGGSSTLRVVAFRWSASQRRVQRSRAGGRRAGRACPGSCTTRTPTMDPSMMSSTIAPTTMPPSVKMAAGCPLRTVVCGTPCTFLATFSRNLELRAGPTTGRMAARTLPPPSVQTTTSSESMDRSPERSPVAHATRKRSTRARP